MTQNTQTTAERIATLINEGVDCSCDGGWTHESVVGVLEVAAVIAAEIDTLTRERDEARAEVERLRPAAEAWEAYDDYMTCPETEEAAKFPVWIAAHRAAKGAQAARAAKESQP